MCFSDHHSDQSTATAGCTFMGSLQKQMTLCFHMRGLKCFSGASLTKQQQQQYRHCWTCLQKTLTSLSHVMCFSDAGHQTAATVPSFLYSLAAETDLVFPFQVLEVLLRGAPWTGSGLPCPSHSCPQPPSGSPPPSEPAVQCTY
jgi:hypothetical protein